MAILLDTSLFENINALDLDYAQKSQAGQTKTGPCWYIVTVNALAANDSPEMRQYRVSAYHPTEIGEIAARQFVDEFGQGQRFSDFSCVDQDGNSLDEYKTNEAARAFEKTIGENTYAELNESKTKKTFQIDLVEFEKNWAEWSGMVSRGEPEHEVSYAYADELETARELNYPYELTVDIDSLEDEKSQVLDQFNYENGFSLVRAVDCEYHQKDAVNEDEFQSFDLDTGANAEPSYTELKPDDLQPASELFFYNFPESTSKHIYTLKAEPMDGNPELAFETSIESDKPLSLEEAFEKLWTGVPAEYNLPKDRHTAMKQFEDAMKRVDADINAAKTDDERVTIARKFAAEHPFPRITELTYRRGSLSEEIALANSPSEYEKLTAEGIPAAMFETPDNPEFEKLSKLGLIPPGIPPPGYELSNKMKFNDEASKLMTLGMIFQNEELHVDHDLLDRPVLAEDEDYNSDDIANDFNDAREQHHRLEKLYARNRSGDDSIPDMYIAVQDALSLVGGKSYGLETALDQLGRFMDGKHVEVNAAGRAADECERLMNDMSIPEYVRAGLTDAQMFFYKKSGRSMIDEDILAKAFKETVSVRALIQELEKIDPSYRVLYLVRDAGSNEVYDGSGNAVESFDLRPELNSYACIEITPTRNEQWALHVSDLIEELQTQRDRRLSIEVDDLGGMFAISGVLVDWDDEERTAYLTFLVGKQEVGV